MHKLKIWMLTAAAMALAACSGGSDDTLTGGSNGPGAQAPVGTLTMLTSSPQLQSDGSGAVTITALVRDSNNNVMPDVTVIFTASSGSLVVSQPATTNGDGILTATLNTGGDPTSRDIVVTGVAGGSAQGSVTVTVSGTEITITGPDVISVGGNGTYTVVLTDSGGDGVANTVVTISSALANGVSPVQVVTDVLGTGTFTLAANNGGAETLTASALGVAFAKPVTVSGVDSFQFTAPAELTEIPLGSNAVVSVTLQQGGVGVANQQITFTATRGTLSAPAAITDGTGTATVTLSANNAGPAGITATNPSGTLIQRNIEFVATTPATLELQANPFTISTNEQSSITAIVRDAAGNLVKNQNVNFALTDFTGGLLTVAQARTNSQGRAQTFYRASSTTSSVNGVRVDATVQGFAGVTDFVNLTVAQREVFISIGTGNTVFEPNSAQYRKEWVIQVTDAQGNGVDLVDVSVSVLSQRYWDGTRAWADPPGAWVTRAGIEALPLAGCPDEDGDRDGVLSSAEDQAGNANGRIEAGNIVLAAAQVGGGSTVQTDVNGFAIVNLFYPQEHAYWLEVTLEARTAVQGTEFVRGTTFVLPGLAADFSQENNAPPGFTSPFGTDGVCATPPPPDGP